MFDNKGIITEDEQILISRYPDDIQERLKDELLKAKEVTIRSFAYDNWIKNMEQGLVITFKENVTLIGQPNTARLARALLEMQDGITRKPLKSELEHDGRLEEFKQYPKGTRVKANGEIVY
jgi:alkylated DNA nucleotide flippase Atl1